MRLAIPLPSILLLLSSVNCAATSPSWYPATMRAERVSAYEWFLISTGVGEGRDRTSACEAADADAQLGLLADLQSRAAIQSQVVAVAGGPSRVDQAVALYARNALLAAPRTQESFSLSDARCYVELRWLMPRDLAAAISRVLNQEATAADVGSELRRALAPEGEPSERQPVDAERLSSLSLTREGAVHEAYAGWFALYLPAPDCTTHWIAFIGSPTGGEARWLELKKTERGWLIVEDQKVVAEGWPTPPSVGLCD